jgi:hypothetical protein
MASILPSRRDMRLEKEPAGSAAFERGWRAALVAARSAAFPLGPVRLDRLTPRQVKPEDWLRFEQSMAEIFAAFGMNLEMPATERTPERFLKALYDATDGCEGDHKLLAAFPTDLIPAGDPAEPGGLLERVG